jgi:hypothetical protein
LSHDIILQTKLSWINFEGIEPIAVPLLPGHLDDMPIEQRKQFSKEVGGKNFLLQMLSWASMSMTKNQTTNPMQAMTDLSVNVARHLLSEHAQGRYNPDLIVQNLFILTTNSKVTNCNF